MKILGEKNYITPLKFLPKDHLVIYYHGEKVMDHEITTLSEIWDIAIVELVDEAGFEYGLASVFGKRKPAPK